MQNAIHYKGGAYVRLSKEDRNTGEDGKTESNSISNQKRLIFDFVESKPDIDIVSVWEDDGYTGTNYDRPAFQQMLEEIKAGKINCVIVKDLSRFGREYINAGKYIDRLFPHYGVRLIAINDGIDTVTKDSSDGLNIILKNLMNDNYCRDISVKIRSQLQVKRKNGEFIGAFAPYGYQKKREKNHNVLEIDAYPAEIVRDIFRWKIDGMNEKAIAEKMTAQGVLSPMEYKRSRGLDYQTGFKVEQMAGWSVVAVRRILTNPVYTGVLIQGIRTRPNYKIKHTIKKDESEWVVVKDAHPAIVSQRSFALVQRLMELDTRTPPGRKSILPLSGITVCGDCRNAMIRKTTSYNGKTYGYYVCSMNKKEGLCSSHRIPDKELEKTVLILLQEHIKMVVEMEACVRAIQEAPLQKVSVKKAEERLEKVQEEIGHYQQLKASLYEDLQEGIICRKDFDDIRFQYDKRIAVAVAARNQLQNEIEMELAGKSCPAQWMEEFLEHRNIQTLTRAVAVECIDEISVFEGKRVEVRFAHAQSYEWLADRIERYYRRAVEGEVG